ncbi:uncharacterized protein LOC132707273 [Cylas formicarius]|uniref:uncharacterized protein LOC132707273 n=1 Tax=Cylas formicarius TaxID=197179 RepID=UPI002958DA6B|nr:uncharacterized protein LOC132707273 [Cylas formicarius]
MFFGKFTTFVTFQICLVCCQKGGSPPASIKVVNLNICPANGKNPIQGDMYLDTVDGFKVLSARIEATRPLNRDITYTFQTDKYSNSDWETDVYTDEGVLCDLLKEYAEDAWNSVRDAIEPKLTNFCDSPAGEYTLDKFEILEKQFKPPPMFGRLMIHLNLYDGDDEHIFCADTEVEVTQKMKQPSFG